MKLLLFAGLDGQRAALEAILQAAKRIGDCELVCLGDAGGQDALELLRKRGVTLVAGASDRARLKDPVGLERAEVGYLRNAAAPRRLVAGGRAFLLTSDPAARDPSCFVILPGERAEVGDRSASAGWVARSGGEAPVLLLDLETGALEMRRVPWELTRHVQ